MGKPEEAAEMLRLLLEAQERVLGQERPDNLQSRANPAAALLGLKITGGGGGGRDA